MFKHIIITRFNIRMESAYDFDKNKKPTNTEKWLDRRFFLFDKYCFPSIKIQSNSNFIWFVLFDSQTPEKYNRRIREYELVFPLFKPLYIEDGTADTIKKIINENITKYLENNEKYIISTRIDNDDAFHKDMINEIQILFNKQKDIILNFNYGLQYDINMGVLVNMYYENNHYISRIEEIGKGVDTVITYNHAFINDIVDVIYINNKKKPIWLELIHDGNISNTLGLSKPLLSDRHLNSFGIEGVLSRKASFILLIAYLKRKVILNAAYLLQKLGLYNFIKRILKG